MRRRAFAVALATAVGGLALVGAEGHGSPAGAGTTGSSYGVFIAGNGLEMSTLGALRAGGTGTQSIVGGDTTTVDMVAVNSTATHGVAVYPDDGTATLREFDPRSGAAQGGFSLPSNIVRVYTYYGLGMDPSDPNRAYSVVAAQDVSGATVTVVNRIDLGARTQTFIGNFPSGMSANSSGDLAVSPDGRTIYVGDTNGQGTNEIFALSTANPAKYTMWSGGVRTAGINDLAVSPDGTFLYANIIYSGGHYLFGFPLPLVGGSTLPPVHSRLASNGGTALTVSPDSQTVYTASFSNFSAGPSTLEAFAGGTGALERSLSIPISSNANAGGGVQGIAVSPDESTLLAFGSSVIYPVQIPGLTLGNPSKTQMGFTNGPQNIVVTPDQAPVARVAPASGSSCRPTTIDAGASSVAYGSIVSYSWDFGDGQAASSGAPVIQHQYANAGNYTATVTETDSVGASVPNAPGAHVSVNGPGQTPYIHASPSARAGAAVGVSRCSGPGIPTTSTSTTTLKPGQHIPGAPVLTLKPTVGSPGTIVIVTGTGFKPNNPYDISWSMSSGSIHVTADSNGNIGPASIAVVVPSVLGPRQAVASSTPPATADFLVVQGSAQPGGSSRGNLFRSHGA